MRTSWIWETVQLKKCDHMLVATPVMWAVAYEEMVLHLFVKPVQSLCVAMDHTCTPGAAISTCLKISKFFEAVYDWR